MRHIEQIAKQKPVVVILMGIPASGKSTFCKIHLTNLVRINLDTLGTRHREVTAIAETFERGESMVIDNTNVTIDERAKYIAWAKEHRYHVVGLFFRSIVRDCVVRNEQREGKAKVPPKAIAAKSNELQMPSYNEGFAEIYFVAQQDNNFTISDWNQ